MNFGTGILIAIMGVVLVFSVLFLLVAVVTVLRKVEEKLSELTDNKKAALSAGKKTEALSAGEPAAALTAAESPLLLRGAEGEDGKIAAAIAAAIAVMTESLPEVKSGKSRFIVRDIRKIG
jgi:Na+-transporting methylmalonyl-CoA/oxaloacetate decarboxylase gamma subunit